MQTGQRLRRLFARAVLPLVTLGACAYFGHHATTGPNGWDARATRLEKLATTRAELQALVETREELVRRAALLNGTEIERDVLDEHARAALGLARSDEVVVVLPAR